MTWCGVVRLSLNHEVVLHQSTQTARTWWQKEEASSSIKIESCQVTLNLIYLSV